MITQIFNINFGYWQPLLLSFIPALINIGIFIFVSFFMTSNRTNKVFAIFVLLIGIVQVQDGLVHMSTTAETATLWAKNTCELYLFVCPLALLFALRFACWHKKIAPPFLLVLLFLPSIFLEMLTSHISRFSIERSDRWNWIVNMKPSLTTDIVTGWTTSLSLLTLILFWICYFREQSEKKKKQSLLLAAGFSFPFIIGVVTEEFFPLILNIDDIPLTTPALTIFSVMSIIAIKKYNMLDYSPRHQWDNIIDKMNEGLVILDNDGKIMYANRKFCTLSGYELKTLMGKDLQDMLSDKVQIGDIDRQVMNESCRAQFILITKTGEKKYVIMSCAPYVGSMGKVIGSINILMNITRIKEMEAMLSQNHKRLKDAQQIAQVGSWELNFATGKSLWSDEACRMYGLSPRDNVHSYESWLSFIHPDDLNSVKERIAIAKQSLGISFMKHRIVCKDGTVKYIHSVSEYEFNEEGVPIGLFGICHDVTERHEAEQALIESEKRIRSFASHLNETIESERRYMAREIHDEFGQYLTGIRLGLSSLKRHSKNDEAAVKRIEALLTDMEACQQSVRKISNKLRPGVLDTLGLIPSMEWLIKDFQKRSDLQIDLTIKNGLKKNYDAHTSICFFRICQEALTNISKHAQASQAVINIKETPDGLLLKISDNGKGISGEKLKNPFSTGLLGMRERAHQIGAGLNITSAEGTGTTVLLELKTA
jgi:PAS domain S-box-containing protein